MCHKSEIVENLEFYVMCCNLHAMALGDWELVNPFQFLAFTRYLLWNCKPDNDMLIALFV